MTKKEAIKEIKSWTPILMFSGQCTEKTSEAQELAISALSADVRENIHGHWIAFSGGYLCSKCRKNVKGVVRVKMVAYKYCPDCGAIMDEVKPKGEKGTE